jgi:hypothetical protein
LSQGRKNDPLKLRWLAQLPRETPLTLKWIAARLKMGTWKHLNRRLYEQGKPKAKHKVPWLGTDPNGAYVKYPAEKTPRTA